jgi:hypothetical protein
MAIKIGRNHLKTFKEVRLQVIKTLVPYIVNPEDRGRRLFRDVGNNLSNYTDSHARKVESL